eukprot:SAG31_NODE_10431_length_1139_cov_2.435577_1_plen_250_part_10
MTTRPSSRVVSLAVVLLLCSFIPTAVDAQAASGSSCNFERSTCRWTESGKNAWTRGSRTPSSGTGANKAHDGKYFMFLETSRGRKGDASYLVSPKLGSRVRSMTFYYHMYGKTMGILSVEVNVHGRWRTLWSKRGQQHRTQTHSWTRGSVKLPEGTSRVRIKGTKGSSFTGDMAVDSVVVSYALGARCPPPPPPRLSRGQSGCKFEHGVCGWTESGKNAWTRGSRTPSSGTGANKAHDGKYFMFLETSRG